MPVGLKNWIHDLTPRDRSALIVLAGFAGAVLLFAFGTQVGGLVYSVLH